jgi:hypothetical protein
LSIVVARSNAGCADSPDEVMVRETGANIVDQSFVESAYRSIVYGRKRHDDLESALTLNEFVALSTDAVKTIDVVGGVRRTDITDGSDQVVADIANAPLITVYLVSATDWVVGVEFVAVAVLHVVVEDTDTFAQNVIVDLVGRAYDALRYSH